MTRPMAVLFAAAVVIGSGLIHGRLSGRWLAAVSPDALDRVLPERLDTWERASPADAGETVLPPKAGEFARVVRFYTRWSDGATVGVLLVRGEPGPMVYNPLICYDAVGYSRLGQPRRRPTANAGEALWEVDLIKPGEETVLRVRWGWGEDGTWQIPDQPRVAFFRSRELYKLYVVSQVPFESHPDSDPAIDFMKEFMPALRTSLSAPSGAGG